MQELEKMINIYHIGFTVCLVLACVCFVLSVLMFFKFDIRRIIDMKTGRGAKKTIQKMEEINARTGKLRQDMVSHTPSVLRPEDRIAYPATAPNLQVQAEASNSGSSVTGSVRAEYSAESRTGSFGLRGNGMESRTGSFGTGASGTMQSPCTEPLADGSQETTVLYQSNETTVLSQNMQVHSQQPEIELPGAFKIEKEIMWIHTEEVL